MSRSLPRRRRHASGRRSLSDRYRCEPLETRRLLSSGDLTTDLGQLDHGRTYFHDESFFNRAHAYTFSLDATAHVDILVSQFSTLIGNFDLQLASAVDLDTPNPVFMTTEGNDQASEDAIVATLPAGDYVITVSDRGALDTGYRLAVNRDFGSGDFLVVAGSLVPAAAPA